MDCDELVGQVTDYLDGALPIRERSRMDSHLRECAGCARQLADLRHTIRLVGSLPRLRPSPALEAKLLAAFREWAAGVAP